MMMPREVGLSFIQLWDGFYSAVGWVLFSCGMGFIQLWDGLLERLYLLTMASQGLLLHSSLRNS